MRGLSSIAALLLLAWQAAIHFVAIIVGRNQKTGQPDMADLPWLIDPTFSSWLIYDLFWFGIAVSCLWIFGRVSAREKVLTEVVRNIHKWREEFFGVGSSGG